MDDLPPHHSKVFEHPFDTLLDPGVKDWASVPQCEHLAFIHSVALVKLQLPMTDWFAGLLVNLQCPNDPPLIVGVEIVSGQGVDHRESLMQKLGTHFLDFLFDFIAKIPIGGWPFKQSP